MVPLHRPLRPPRAVACLRKRQVEVARVVDKVSVRQQVVSRLALVVLPAVSVAVTAVVAVVSVAQPAVIPMHRVLPQSRW